MILIWYNVIPSIPEQVTFTCIVLQVDEASTSRVYVEYSCWPALDLLCLVLLCESMWIPLRLTLLAKQNYYLKTSFLTIIYWLMHRWNIWKKNLNAGGKKVKGKSNQKRRRGRCGMRRQIVCAFPYRGEHMHACRNLSAHGDVIALITKFENLNWLIS